VRRESEELIQIRGLEYPDHKLCQDYLFCDRTIDNVAVSTKKLGVIWLLTGELGRGNCLDWWYTFLKRSKEECLRRMRSNLREGGCGGYEARQFFPEFRFYGEILAKVVGGCGRIKTKIVFKFTYFLKACYN